MNKSIVLIPIYTEELTPLEEFSLKHSLLFLNKQIVRFICPNKLNTKYYEEKFPYIAFDKFDSKFFETIAKYSELLLSRDFYINYIDKEFMLILQTDALIISPDLEKWINLNFDYIGAPWPDKFKLQLKWDKFSNHSYEVSAVVGNGGFSLRNVKNTILLLDEFKETVNFFIESGSSEDLFFATAGIASNHFKLPNEIVASLFSLELEPQYYVLRNGNQDPFGGHAWWKYSPEFWLHRIQNPVEALTLLKKYYALNNT